MFWHEWIRLLSRASKPIDEEQKEQILRCELEKSPGFSQHMFAYRQKYRNAAEGNYTELAKAFDDFRSDKRKRENLLKEQGRQSTPSGGQRQKSTQSNSVNAVTDPKAGAKSSGKGIKCHKCGADGALRQSVFQRRWRTRSVQRWR